MKPSSLCEANVKAVGDELFELVEGVVEFLVEFVVECAPMEAANSLVHICCSTPSDIWLALVLDPN